MAEKRKNELKMAREGKTVRMVVDGVIGWDYWGTTASEFRRDLKGHADGANTLEMEIDSPGGVITEGVAIANAVLELDAAIHTYVSGLAASMGSVLLMAGDKMFVPSNAMVMVHKPMNMVMGNADEMRKTADDLDKFETALMSMYMRHFKGSEEDMKALMAKETWLTADDMEDKFNNVVIMKSELQAVACEDPIALFGSDAPENDTYPNLFDKFINRLRTEGLLPKAVKKEETVEDTMTPEEKAALKAETTEAVMTALKEAGVIKAEEAPEETPVAKIEIAFEGDMDKPEDVEAHALKVERAQLRAAVDWNDLDSVRAYQEAIKPVAVKGTVLPAGNVETETVTEARKQDQEDTSNFMAKHMPKAR